MAVKTGVMGSSEPALVFSLVALQRTQTLKTNERTKPYVLCTTCSFIFWDEFAPVVFTE